MTEFILGVLAACLGSFGFSFLFRVDLKYIMWGVLGGALNWAAYLAVLAVTDGIFASALAGAIVATFYAELLAYIFRTPATVFLLPSLIPLVPGGSLYYTMSNLITKNYDVAAVKGMQTAEVMLGTSLGVVMASLVVYAVRHVVAQKKKNK